MDEPLFAALAREAVQCLGKFNEQALANTGWAFTTADWSDALLLTALVRAAEERARARGKRAA